jgi:hypothetical protein
MTSAVIPHTCSFLTTGSNDTVDTQIYAVGTTNYYSMQSEIMPQWNLKYIQLLLIHFDIIYSMHFD